jgi:hypothetical protein
MKQQYRICNWSEYNASLKQRGSLTFWVSDAAKVYGEGEWKTRHHGVRKRRI